MFHRLLALGIPVLLASAAPAAPRVRVIVPELEGTAAPEVGPVETLSGSLVAELGELPLSGSATTFELLDLALFLSDGTEVILDPTLEDPGLGILGEDGVFEIPILFLQLAQGVQTADLAIPDLVGDALFDQDGSRLLELETVFELDSLGPQGVFTITLLPEPAVANGAPAALAWLALLGWIATRRRGTG